MGEKNTQPLAVITGGASGIGLSAVKRFLDEGYEVLILDANKDAGDQSVNNLKSDTCNVNFAYCDITNHAQLDTVSVSPISLKLSSKVKYISFREGSVTGSKNFLNSVSSTSFIVLFINSYSNKYSSLTLQITSTIAFPIPKIFILSFFCFNGFFSVRITSGTNFTS